MSSVNFNQRPSPAPGRDAGRRACNPAIASGHIPAIISRSPGTLQAWIETRRTILSNARACPGHRGSRALRPPGTPPPRPRVRLRRAGARERARRPPIMRLSKYNFPHDGTRAKTRKTSGFCYRSTCRVTARPAVVLHRTQRVTPFRNPNENSLAGLVPNRGSIGLQRSVLAENRIGTIIATSPAPRLVRFRFPAVGRPISIYAIGIGAVCVRSRDWADFTSPENQRCPSFARGHRLP